MAITRELFLDTILPQLNEQTRDGMVILVNDDVAAVVPASDLADFNLEVEPNGWLMATDLTDDYRVGTDELVVVTIPASNEELETLLKSVAPEFFEYELEDGSDVDVSILGADDLQSILDMFADPMKVSEVGKAAVVTLPLEEAKTDDPATLADELAEIKPLADEYGFEYFTAMPFTSYDNDPQSIEYQYPNFFKVAKSFFKEMGLITTAEMKDPDILDAEWDTDVEQHDWDTMIRVADMLANGVPNVQYEKIFKTGLDLGEALNEDTDLAVANSNKFLRYLKDQGVKSGHFSEIDPEVEHHPDDYDHIHLYAQGGTTDIYFYPDGAINFVDHRTEDSVADDIPLDVDETFSNWSEFRAYLQNDNWFWSPDMGMEIPEDYQRLDGEPSPFDEPEFDPDRELTDEERLQAEMAWEDNTRRHNI